MARCDEGVPVYIIEVGRDRLDDLRELWLALHRYHAEIGSHPLVTDDDCSWQRRLAQYDTWLRAGEALILLATRQGEPVGYAVCHLQDGPGRLHRRAPPFLLLRNRERSSVGSFGSE